MSNGNNALFLPSDSHGVTEGDVAAFVSVIIKIDLTLARAGYSTKARKFL